MSELELPSIVGVLGLSPLGAAIARRLAAKGIRIAAYDADCINRGRLADASPLIEIAATLADIGHDCDVVISTLDGGALAAIMVGSRDEPGLGLLMAPGALVIDVGASAPHDARRLAFVLGSRGIALVDAPALGTPDDATANTLSIPLGGFPDFVDRARPLLQLLGAITQTGQVGSGHTLAALLAARSAAEARIAAEFTALTAAAGLPPANTSRMQPAAMPPVASHPSHLGERAGVSGQDGREDPATAIRLAVARGLVEQYGIDTHALLASVHAA